MKPRKTTRNTYPPSAEKDIVPDHVFESLARCALPLIQAYYESDEGQREFAEWKTEKAEMER